MRLVNFKLQDTLHMRMKERIYEGGFDSLSTYMRTLVERDLNADDSNSRLDLLINTRSDEIKASVDSIIKALLCAATKEIAANKTDN